MCESVVTMRWLLSRRDMGVQKKIKKNASLEITKIILVIKGGIYESRTNIF